MSLYGAIASLAPGKKLTYGTVTFDGSNPTTVAHGLAKAEAVYLTMIGSAALADLVTAVTGVINGNNIDIYAWTNTTGTDPTLVASTDNTRQVFWMAIGDAVSAS